MKKIAWMIKDKVSRVIEILKEESNVNLRNEKYVTDEDFSSENNGIATYNDQKMSELYIHFKILEWKINEDSDKQKQIECMPEDQHWE